MAEPSPLGETSLRDIVLAMAEAEPMNVPAGGWVESVVTDRTHRRLRARDRFAELIDHLKDVLQGVRQHVSCVRISGHRLSRKEKPMSVARVVEISSTSSKNFEDAIVQGVARANETLRNVKSAWVKEQEAEVLDGKVVAYKVNLKVTFVLDGARS